MDLGIFQAQQLLKLGNLESEKFVGLPELLRSSVQRRSSDGLRFQEKCFTCREPIETQEYWCWMSMDFISRS